MDKEYQTTVDTGYKEDISVIVHYEMDGYKPLLSAIYQHPSKGLDIDLLPALSDKEYERVYNEVCRDCTDRLDG